MLKDLLSASPESLFFGTLFMLIMLISKLANKNSWMGQERRDSLFTDRQRLYIEERIKNTVNGALEPLSEVRTCLRQIEKDIQEQNKLFYALERRVAIHEATSDDSDRT